MALSGEASTPLKTMGIVGLYAIVGTSLTLVNKLVMHRYPHGSALMLLQCSVTVALVVALTPKACFRRWGRSARWSGKRWRRGSPSVFFFVGMLLSSV